MTDIARLGLSAETQPIKDAAKDLDRLSQSAKSAGAAADKFSASSSKMGAGLKGAASGASGAQSSVTRLAEGYDLLTGKVDRNFMAISKNIESWNRIPAAANGATSALNRLGKSASDNINRMQATPGNIAAQFQDIGVTAAGGMNPMIIALQQGTQLGAAMSGGLGDLGNAFKQILSPINLFTIGLVGLAALGIQMVDWAQLAADALNGLADVIVEISPYLALLAAGLVAIYAPAIIAGIGALTVAMYNLAAGILAVIGLPALLVIGFVAMVAAAVEFRDELTEIFGVDIVGVVADTINKIIGTFVGAFNGIKAVWGMLPAAFGDVAIRAANAVIRIIADMVGKVITLLNPIANILQAGGLDIGGMVAGGIRSLQMDNPFEGMERSTGAIIDGFVRAGQQVNYIGAGIDLIKKGARTAADYLREWAGALTDAGDAAAGKDKKTKSARAAKGKSQAELWAELLVGADKQMRGLEQAGAQIGIYGEALSRLQFEQQLFNEAQDKGIVLTAAMSAELTKRAAAMAQVAEANRKAAFMEDLVQDAEMLNLQLERERGELGLTGAALIAYRYETEKLVAAKRAHIDLSPEELEAIRQAGILYGEQADAIAKASQALEDNKATVRGVFDAIAESITKGTNLWDNLANVFDRVVDRMVSRLLDDLMDAIFQVNNAVGGGGGFFGSLLGLAGSIGGGGGLNVSGGPITGIDTSGSIGGIPGFAKGGAFTNGVVDSPTMFKFANGGKFGVMGEAGPEAVMPLKRGSDGSLGVQVHGGNNDNAPSFTFDLRGAVVTQDILDQMNQIASQQANVAVNQNNVRQQRQSQRALGKR